MSLRKGCELQLKTVEAQLNEERAKVAALEASRHQDNLAFGQARQELEETKELLGKIGLLVRSDKQAAIPAARCV
jgi:multidrug resistance efflux pump